MLVLLSDGCALASLQAARCLARPGPGASRGSGRRVAPRVEVLAPDPRCLCRFSGAVSAVHRVPRYGDDPLGWFDAALAIARRRGADVLLPTQEQAAVLSLRRDRLEAAGVATAVPAFSALRRVQDKVCAAATLAELGVARPEGTVVADAAGRERWCHYPSFAKAAIGTASGGVWRLDGPADWADVPMPTTAAPIVVEAAVPGPLVMVQAVFAHGRLVAFAANTREREGVRGGASHKRSVEVPDARSAVARLGARLDWHGALSADVILGPDGPVVIDVNPRLVEPANAAAAGVDLVGALLEVAVGGDVVEHPAGRPGVRTHQLALALLGAAARTGRRRAVAAELWAGLRGSGDYRGGQEELAPIRHDPGMVLPLALAASAVLARPRAWRAFAGDAVANYALTPTGWSQLLAAADTPDPHRSGSRL